MGKCSNRDFLHSWKCSFPHLSNVLIKKLFLCISQKHSEEATKAASSDIFVCKNRCGREVKWKLVNKLKMD